MVVKRIDVQMFGCRVDGHTRTVDEEMDGQTKTDGRLERQICLVGRQIATNRQIEKYRQIDKYRQMGSLYLVICSLLASLLASANRYKMVQLK